MKKFSSNKKLNGVLNEIYDGLLESVGIDEIKRYYYTFSSNVDYNIVKYGNMYIYYSDIYALYERHGYKSISKYSKSKIWEVYKRQVGYVTRYIINGGCYNG